MLLPFNEPTVRLEIPYWSKTTTQILKVLAKLILEEFYIHFHLDGSLTLYVVWSRTWTLQ